MSAIARRDYEFAQSSPNDGKDVVAGRRAIVYGMNYAPEIAGIGKYTGEIAQHLASVGVDVTVVTTPPHYPGWRVQNGYSNVFSTETHEGIKVLRSPLILKEKMGGVWRLVAPLSFALTSAPIIFWQIIRRRPETVYCVEPTLFAAPVAQVAAKLVGARTVLHVQDLEVDAAFAVGHLTSNGWLKRLAFAYERYVLSRFNSVVTISNRMADRLVAKGLPTADVSVVRNWVDLEHIYPLDGPNSYRKEQGFDERDFVVLYSGNIGAKQGLNVLLDAARLLGGEPKIHFVIAGEGPSKTQLAADYGELSNVRFLPFQPYARLNEFMNMPDLHILPQDRNTADLVLPSKLGGMLASGKRILITADRGTELAEFVDGLATVIPPGDPVAIAQSIKLQAQSPRTEIAARNLSSVYELLEKRNGLAALLARLFP